MYGASYGRQQNNINASHNHNHDRPVMIVLLFNHKLPAPWIWFSTRLVILFYSYVCLVYSYYTYVCSNIFLHFIQDRYSPRSSDYPSTNVYEKLLCTRTCQISIFSRSTVKPSKTQQLSNTDCSGELLVRTKFCSWVGPGWDPA